MTRPVYKLTFGSTTIDSAADPTRSTVIALNVALDLDTPADQLVVQLGSVGGVQPGLDVDVELVLGYAGDSQTKVFTGTVSDVRPDITGTWITVLSPMKGLLELRVDKTYENKTAGQIVRDLAGQADVDIDAVEDGVNFLAYVADSGRHAYGHVRALADKSGFDVYTNPDGQLRFRSFSGSITVHVFEYGQHIINLVVQDAPVAAGEVQVIGESPADAQGDEAFAWLTKSFNPATAGSGSPTRVIADPSLRTQTAARTAAQAEAKRLQQQALTGRLLALGRPQVKLGDAIRISGAPDDRMNTTFQVRRVRHRLTKAEGFISEIDFWQQESNSL